MPQAAPGNARRWPRRPRGDRGARPAGAAAASSRAAISGAGSSGSPASSDSAGTMPVSWAWQRGHSRACRATRLRHSGLGVASQPVVTEASAEHGGRARSARTTSRAVVSRSFMRLIRTAV